jgi:alpha/beta superfamily hydrolase
MNSQTRRIVVAGPAGAIEALRDEPAAGVAPRGTAVIAHPHPLFGGTMDNKVVQTLARAWVQAGWSAVRFNFRGVGAT